MQDVTLTSAFLYMAAAGLLLLLVSAKLALAPAPAPAPAPADALRGAAGAYGISAGSDFPHLTLPALARAPAGAAAPAAAAPGERTGAQRGGAAGGDGSAGAGGDAHAELGLQQGHHRHRQRHYKRHVPAGGGAPSSDRERAGAWYAPTEIHNLPLPCFPPSPTSENTPSWKTLPCARLRLSAAKQRPYAHCGMCANMCICTRIRSSIRQASQM